MQADLPVLLAIADEAPAPRLADLSDEALVAAFRAGDPKAFEHLFDRYADRIRGLIVRLTGDHALARDLTQVTFLSVVRGRGRFTEDGNFRAWVFTVAMNALRDHQRRAKREVLSDRVPETAVEARPPDRGLEREVRAALATLPDDQRQAVVLHHLDGFSFDEVAQMVGCSRSAAKVRAHRGYKKLRGLLEDTWTGEPR